MNAETKRAVQTALAAAKVARLAANDAFLAARFADADPTDALRAAAYEAAVKANRVGRAAEEAAMDIDPEEAFEHADVWQAHCFALGAFDRAMRATRLALEASGF